MGMLPGNWGWGEIESEITGYKWYVEGNRKEGLFREGK